ncbi:MAG: hypothetical protein ACTHO8_05805 [Solirubrobacterales bacterium]
MLGVAGVFIGRMWEFPGTGANAAVIATFVDVHHSALLADMFLTTAAVGLWLPFGIGVWLCLSRPDAKGSLLPGGFLVGIVSLVTLLLAGFAVFFVALYRAPEVNNPQLLYDLSFALLAMSGLPTVLTAASYGFRVLRSAALPKWTAWLALAVALAHLLLLASLAIRSGFFSLEGGVTIAIPAILFAWILATSIAMLTKKSMPRDPP